MAAAFLVCAIAALALMALDHPSRYSFIPQCPTRTLAGVYCAGCGSLRCAHYTLRGDLPAAVRANPVALVMGAPAAVIAVGIAALAVLNRKLDGPARAWWWIGWVVLIVVIVFTIVRNLPGSMFDVVRPRG